MKKIDEARLVARLERMSALRDGRKQRAVRFTDRKKEADRRKCRGKQEAE